MIGFWVCPLLGAVIGNGYHEIMLDRAKREARAVSDERNDTMVDPGVRFGAAVGH